MRSMHNFAATDSGKSAALPVPNACRSDKKPRIVVVVYHRKVLWPIRGAFYENVVGVDIEPTLTVVLYQVSMGYTFIFFALQYNGRNDD